MLDEERRALQDFLREAQDLLGAMADHFAPEWFPDEVVPQIRASWAQVQPNLEQVSAAIGTGDYDEALEGVGLAGASLDLKLTGFRRAVVAFWEDVGPRRFRRVLKWLNILFGSLGAVLPGGRGRKGVQGGFGGEPGGRGLARVSSYVLLVRECARVAPPPAAGQASRLA